MPAPTLEHLQRYYELDEKRKALNRQAEDLAKLQADLKEQFIHYVEEFGGSDRTTMRFGYRLTLVEKAGTVPWAKEFLRVGGYEEAERLRQLQPKTESLVVQPPAE